MAGELRRKPKGEDDKPKTMIRDTEEWRNEDDEEEQLSSIWGTIMLGWLMTKQWIEE